MVYQATRTSWPLLGTPAVIIASVPPNALAVSKVATIKKAALRIILILHLCRLDCRWERISSLRCAHPERIAERLRAIIFSESVHDSG